jgi:hypothetical protein
VVQGHVGIREVENTKGLRARVAVVHVDGDVAASGDHRAHCGSGARSENRSCGAPVEQGR